MKGGFGYEKFYCGGYSTRLGKSLQGDYKPLGLAFPCA